MTSLVASSAPAVVDQLAQLTRYRDRDLLDMTLAGAFRDLLNPRTVAIYRKVGEAGNERWITRARLGKTDSEVEADPIGVEINTLPRLQDHPIRCQALAGERVEAQAEDCHVTVFPLVTEREVAGVIEIRSDGALVSDAHRMVSGMLHVYRNFESLLDYSERDTLTGLLNRKTFDESFLKIVSSAAAPLRPVTNERRAQSSTDPYWVGMVDIDHFKSVNDKYGHLIGDEVLLLMARVMLNSFRYHDRLYRFGGEEFVILMRAPTEADAARVFERLRNNTEKHRFPQVGQVTISLGFTQVLPGDSPATALERADQAVYYAKTHGRNQVHCYAELLRRGEIKAAHAHVGEVDLF